MSGVALITGSSRGIGLATAIALAKQGFSLALNGLFDDDELKTAEKQISALNVPVMRAAFDVSDLSQHSAALEKISLELGDLTCLVNNAGVGVIERGDLLEVSEESYDKCQNVNAKAVFFLSQAFAKHLLKQPRMGGQFYSIVNVTSSNAGAVAVQRAEYCASKAAAAMTSKAFAVRLGVENIYVYDVQPGLIATEMTSAVIGSYEDRVKTGLTLIPEIGQPEDIGKVIASLATGKLPYTTGQVISVDGGLLVPRY